MAVINVFRHSNNFLPLLLHLRCVVKFNVLSVPVFWFILSLFVIFIFLKLTGLLSKQVFFFSLFSSFAALKFFFFLVDRNIIHIFEGLLKVLVCVLFFFLASLFLMLLSFVGILFNQISIGTPFFHSSWQLNALQKFQSQLARDRKDGLVCYLFMTRI